jgi:hypothetical protein
VHVGDSIESRAAIRVGIAPLSRFERAEAFRHPYLVEKVSSKVS